MEDAHIAYVNTKDSVLKNDIKADSDKPLNIPSVALFGVFDGHGGSEVATYVKKNFV